MTSTPVLPALDPSPVALRWRPEFPIFERTTYLNTCSLGALSRRARARVNEHLDLWEAMGASAWYEIWWAALADLRAGYARVIGAAPHEIALQPNANAALTMVAEALDYGTRRRIVTTALDFPTIPYQWLSKPGVEVVVLEPADGVRVLPEQFADEVDDRTALVITSHVYFTTGALQDAAALATIAHRHGALCFIDGYQAAGQVPVDVHALGVDFYCGGGLKWLMGGTGTAFLYVREGLHRQLAPTTAGWFGHKEQFRFDPRDWTPHDDARRFEGGTNALPSVYLQLGGLEVLEQVGIPEARRVTMELAEDLIARAEEAGLRPRVAPTPAERTGIVMLPSDDPRRDVARLAERGYVVDARPGHVRVSPFFYNLPDDHRGLLEALRDR
ncbi:MAG: aminotransferase class V-fold PLP-dependent enzyme [Gemmatimonadales bacterium]|nr:aminotransferase class V-fold PLP-dependent enzyme [Gemmatimonadales bacterium]